MSPTERLFFLLDSRELTAADASRATGISQGNFTEWRKGRSKPGYGALVKLARYLNVSVEYLECKTDDPAPSVNYDDDLEAIGQKARQLPPAQQAAFKKAMKAFLDKLVEQNKH